MASWLHTIRRMRRRRRWQGLFQLSFLLVATFSIVGFCLLRLQDDVNPHFRSRTLLNAHLSNDSEETNVTVKKSDPLFPPPIFTIDELRYKGGVIPYIVGMVYMFVALAIVCDEFFVPSLDVIIEKLHISEDVAGATFMAAGGSAPELFTSVIGVFISFDDVGIGTIVGSAVFNILFVIAMCVLFSKTVLDLTWWPLFRDITFYSIALLMLVLFFLDAKIYWYEALLMFIIYILYCSFMKVNETIEKFVKKHLNKNKVTRVCSTDQLVPNRPGVAALMPQMRRQSVVPVLHSGTKFRQGLLQLMIHTIDPLHDGKVDEKATQLHAIASLKVLLDSTKPQNGRVEAYRSTDGLSPEARPDGQSHLSGRSSQGTEVTHVDSVMSADMPPQGPPQINGDLMDPNALPHGSTEPSFYQCPNCGKEIFLTNTPADPTLGLTAPIVPLRMKVKPAENSEIWSVTATTDCFSDLDNADEEEETKPIDLSWPRGFRKRIIYLLVAPIIFPLWITLPDTRSTRGKRFFMVTFIGSILWIAAFSYLMVWWATVIGTTIDIPSEVMGLTVLAAGTSVPDLITSVIVARKGFGDMAVSSSIGSNIFDVCCGLPIPWLLFAFGQLIMNFVNNKENPWKVPPIEVSSAGMACSIMLLFAMLMFVLGSIICSRWKMNKGLGLFMFFLYFVFVAVSLSFEYDIILCPI